MSVGNDPELGARMADFITLYNQAEKVYKGVQQIVSRIDAQVHNEFRYCARALVDFLQHQTPNGNNKDIDEAVRLLGIAEHAAKNALNDSIDLLVAHAKIEIQKLASIETGRPIASFYTDFREAKAAILSIESKTEETRRNRDSRVEAYIELSSSSDFEAIKKLCRYLPDLESEINVEYGRRVTEARRFSVTVFLSFVGILVGLPGFYDWGSRLLSANSLASLPQSQLVQHAPANASAVDHVQHPSGGH